MPSSKFYPVVSQAYEVIDQSVAQVQRGLSYMATFSEAIGDTSVATVLIRTPATTAYRIKFSVVATKNAAWTFEEGTTATAGTSLTNYCHNRTIADDALLLMSHTPELGTAGSVIDQGVLFINSPGPNESSCWVLNPETDYVIRLTATTALTTIIRITNEVVR